MTKTITLELTEDDVYELETNWGYWSDESYEIHAAYVLREALIRSGYATEDDINL